MKINDVVFIKGEKFTPRDNWRKVKVEELTVSRESKIRGAVLSLYNKKTDTRTFLLKRPVQRLIVFEIMNCVKEDNENISNLINNRQQ